MASPSGHCRHCAAPPSEVGFQATTSGVTKGLLGRALSAGPGAINDNYGGLPNPQAV
jgi:hypothetical protein